MQFHSYPNIYPTSLTLKIQDLETSIKFYENIIGFRLLAKTDKNAVLTVDGTTPLLYLEQLEKAESKNTRTTGLYHFAILVPSREDLGIILQHLLKSGFPLQGASDHNVSEAIYLADPEGNGIEIYRDLPAENWQWQNDFVQMSTLAMDAEGVLEAGSNNEWNGLPAGSIIGHIHLHVADLEKTVAFYVEGLGFDIVQKYGTQAYFISTGKYHHHIGLNIWNGRGIPAPKAENVGLKYFDLKIPTEEKRNEIAERVEKLGEVIEKKDDIFYVSDPSGNTIRLIIK
ncbi:VOC family protein [Niallia sp. NCCP-28]|uniref:VOC family protein n=1 Tax=Niallia sp. NCCP-28 TaxID=2934712 RepID=UPI0020889B5C|nr:VOC family protein [Niallia sp. NCCP-28]GKU84472.1 glyoxalase [Niallia sp. NCCP-28]